MHSPVYIKNVLFEQYKIQKQYRNNRDILEMCLHKSTNSFIYESWATIYLFWKKNCRISKYKRNSNYRA